MSTRTVDKTERWSDAQDLEPVRSRVHDSNNSSEAVATETTLNETTDHAATDTEDFDPNTYTQANELAEPYKKIYRACPNGYGCCTMLPCPYRHPKLIGFTSDGRPIVRPYVPEKRT